MSILRDIAGSVGAIEICRVVDSTLNGETMQTWFPDFNRDAVRPHEHWLCPDHFNPESGHFPMPVCSWVFRMQGRTVLVDTCIGNHKQRAGVNEMHMLNTRYLERLIACGVNPEDVDYVLCSHLHLDHVGWNTQLENGRWVPTFPNAQYIFNRDEYAATAAQASLPGTAKVFQQIFEDSIHPIVAAGKACLVDGIYELFDGLILRPAPGHSPGHVRIELTSQGMRGVLSGDMLHSPVQVPLWQWSTRVCWNREMAAHARRELLEFCVANDALLLPCHFVAPHVGRIRQAGPTFSIDFGW